MSDKPLTIGMLLFADVTQLDFTAPYEVFSRMPQTRVHVLAPRLDPVRSEHGLILMPDTAFADAPPLDILFVPGGGVDPLMEDQTTLEFLRFRASSAQYVTSVCTGALLLGAAGLLRGYRATTHWLSLDILPVFGAQPVKERVVIDRNRITGGGVTAGIDFGLTLAAQLRGEDAAQSIQLLLEYSPAPPFNSGSPDTAPAPVVAGVTSKQLERHALRMEIAKRAASRFAAH